VNSTRINQLLYTTAAILVAGGAIVVALGGLLPLDAGPSTSAQDASRPTVSESALPSFASLEPIWDLKLCGELAPAPASPQQPARLAADVAPATQGVPVSLVGTIGDSLAILRQESGQVDVRAAGENVAGVEVLDVRPARVRVRYNGQELTLEKPLDARPPGL
jgi:hypothetical protein